MDSSLFFRKLYGKSLFAVFHRSLICSNLYKTKYDFEIALLNNISYICILYKHTKKVIKIKVIGGNFS